MNIINQPGWVYYVEDNTHVDKDKNGKWMYYFYNKDFASKVCEKAVSNGIVKQSKHSNADDGVACFYLSCDDIDSHKRVITFFIENNLIPKTKEEKFYNISFKLDSQTRAGEYGKDFQSKINLAQFINLNTGEWII